MTEKPAKKPAPHAARSQKKLRIDFTEDLMAREASHKEIVAAVTQKYGISVKQSYKYISWVYRRWEKHPELEKKNAKLAQVRRLHKLRGEAHQMGDLKTVVKIEELLAKILGTLAPKELSGPEGRDLGFKVEITDYRSSNAN